MKKEELKIVISISSVVSMIIGGIYIWIKAEDMNLQNIFRAVSYGLSISTFFWAFYFSKGWKWSMLDKIFYRPNLNGTWSGVLISDWKNPNKNKGIKNIAYMYIKDTTQQGDNDILQEGAAELRYIESDVKTLEGKYFSNIKTNGKIKVNFSSRKHVDSFIDARKMLTMLVIILNWL